MVNLNQNPLLAQEKILDLAKQYGTNKSVSTAKETIVHQRDADEDKHLKEELQHLAQKYNHEMRKLNTNVSFSYDDTIEGLLVTVKEENSEKVIREIPSKEAIELMKKMQDLVGMIFSKEG